MRFNPEIFKAYDIRGIYGQDFDEDFAFKLGAATVEYLKSKKLIIGRDARPTSPQLAEALIHGINSMGCDVIVPGMVSSPFFYYAINETGAGGGIMVTASHNDMQYNGFKIYRDGAFPLDSEVGLLEIKKILDSDNVGVSKYAGKILSQGNLSEKYTSFILEESGLKPGEIDINVSVDADEVIQRDIRPIFQKLNIQIIDNAKISFKFDTDGDRVAVMDSTGERIRSDLIIAILASNLKKGWFSKPKIVHDFRFSRGVLDKLSSTGIKLIRSRVGHTFIKKLMKKEGADLGGELSGHTYFKEAKYVENAILAMLKILKIVSSSGKGIDELVEPFKTWHNSGELNFKFFPHGFDFQKIAEKLKERYKDGKIDELDGLTVEYAPKSFDDDWASWWFNIRPSNTEPVLRLVVEAKTKNLLVEKVVELGEMLKQ